MFPTAPGWRGPTTARPGCGARSLIGRDVCDYCERATVDNEGDALADVLVCDERAEAHLACANLGRCRRTTGCAQCVEKGGKPPSAPSPPPRKKKAAPAAKPRTASPRHRARARAGAASDSSSDDDDVNARAQGAGRRRKKRATRSPIC